MSTRGTTTQVSRQVENEVRILMQLASKQTAKQFGATRMHNEILNVPLARPSYSRAVSDVASGDIHKHASSL